MDKQIGIGCNKAKCHSLTLTSILDHGDDNDMDPSEIAEIERRIDVLVHC